VVGVALTQGIIGVLVTPS